MDSVIPSTLHIFAEHSVVRLNRDVQLGAKVITAGTSGTVVHVYRDALAYAVEFFEPAPAVVTLLADDLTQ